MIITMILSMITFSSTWCCLRTEVVVELHWLQPLPSVVSEPCPCHPVSQSKIDLWRLNCSAIEVYIFDIILAQRVSYWRGVDVSEWMNERRLTQFFEGTTFHSLETKSQFEKQVFLKASYYEPQNVLIFSNTKNDITFQKSLSTFHCKIFVVSFLDFIVRIKNSNCHELCNNHCILMNESLADLSLSLIDVSLQWKCHWMHRLISIVTPCISDWGTNSWNRSYSSLGDLHVIRSTSWGKLRFLSRATKILETALNKGF